MLKAITAAKKKNDQADAEKITDLLRVNLLPECAMLPQEIRELRRILRYRNHLVRTAVNMHNKMSGLLMEVGAGYSKNRLRGKIKAKPTSSSARNKKRLRKKAAYALPKNHDLPAGPRRIGVFACGLGNAT